MLEPPPCLSVLGVTNCLRRQHDWLIYGSGPLHGPWEGWRIAGPVLVDPDGRRIHLNRVRAVMTQDELRRRPGASATIVPFTARSLRCTTP